MQKARPCHCQKNLFGILEGVSRERKKMGCDGGKNQVSETFPAPKETFGMMFNPFWIGIAPGRLHPLWFTTAFCNHSRNATIKYHNGRKVCITIKTNQHREHQQPPQQSTSLVCSRWRILHWWTVLAQLCCCFRSPYLELGKPVLEFYWARCGNWITTDAWIDLNKEHTEWP